MTRIELLSLLALAVFWLLFGRTLVNSLFFREPVVEAPDHRRLRKFREALKREQMKPSKVATEYWRLYSYTRKPKSEWILMSREEKSSCFKTREELRKIFERLPEATQKIVMSERPK